MTAEARRILTDLQLRLRRRYGDRLIEPRLFGPRARGDARPDSDYDVLVLLRSPVDVEAELFRSSPDSFVLRFV